LTSIKQCLSVDEDFSVNSGEYNTILPQIICIKIGDIVD
jgi:hypothetical protein